MPNNKFTYWNEVWETDVDVGNNRSIVHCRVHLKANGSGWQTTRSFSGSVNINGINRSFSWSPGNNTFPYASHNRAVIAEFSDWVQHGVDGKLTVSVSSVYNSNGTYSPGYCSANNTFICTSIPRAAKIINANDFTDEENPYVSINNPGGFNLSIKLEAGGLNSIVNRPNIGNVTSYTFALTEEERDILRKKCLGRDMPVRYTVITRIGNDDFYEYVDRTMTIVNANPSFKNFSVEDDNSSTLALTGNNQKYISGYSNALITINNQEKAIAKKYASIEKYKLNEIEVLNNETEPININLNNIKDSVIEVYAIDSRGNSTKVIKNIELIDYKNIVIKNILANRNGATQSSKLSFNGIFSNVDFGNKKNTIKLIKYRYKIQGKINWSEYIDITNDLNITDNSFKFSRNIKGDLGAEGFNIINNYDIQVIVEDLLSSYCIETILQSAKPLLAIEKSRGVSIGKVYDENIGGDLQVKNLVAENIKFTKAQRSAITCFSDNVFHNGGKWSDVPIKYTKNINIGDAFEVVNGEKVMVKKDIGAVGIFANFIFTNNTLETANAIYVSKAKGGYVRKYVKSNNSKNDSLYIVENVEVGDTIHISHYTHAPENSFETTEGCLVTIIQL